MPRTSTKKTTVSRRVAAPAARRRVVKKSSSYKKSTARYLGSAADRAVRYVSRAAKSLGRAAIGSVAPSLLDAYNVIAGNGTYKMTRNSLMDLTSQSVPFMHSAKDGVRIRHREFLQDVSSSTLFVNTVYNINPGLSESFPWLSAIAQNFEEYKFEGLAFEFVSTSADALNSTNTALGTVILAAEYNTLAPAFVNKQQMENNMWAISGKPSSCQIMPIECAPHLNPLSNLYIRLGSVPSGADQRMYDLANFEIATVGSQASAVIGELWVTYDVVLLKPQLSSGLNLSGQSAHYALNSVAVTTAYFGTSQTLKFDSIGLTFSGTVITFPLGSQGHYLISYSVTGSSASVADPTFTISSNGGYLDIFTGSTVGTISNTGDTATVYNRTSAIYIKDPTIQVTITASVGTLPTSATSGDLVITQLNGNLNS